MGFLPPGLKVEYVTESPHGEYPKGEKVTAWREWPEELRLPMLKLQYKDGVVVDVPDGWLRDKEFANGRAYLLALTLFLAA